MINIPLTNKGQKIAANLQKEYGDKWKNVFYGGVTKGRFKGVEPAKSEKKLRSRYKGGTTKKKKSSLIGRLGRAVKKLKRG